ncbi:PDR6 [Candida pseudojiufengensis]|uniref:PDR6 n=1 Tax=Candida pseudojiufengensis TaxID=497109 RepID=UPI00222597CB|nr:PDR6 [Candida pseudojiufengensis]KAI5960596.1 PDR6 [Candida pseudojiufengensis]
MSSQLNIDDVIKHVELLYTTRNPEEVRIVQEQLQVFQKNEYSFQLGVELLHNPNNQVRYFGALTITVYLNTYGSDDFIAKFVQISNILEQLIEENYNANSFIIRKLMSNLSILYIQHFEEFDCVLLFIRCLKHNENETISTFLSTLHDVKQLEILILFLQILSEEIQKLITFSLDLHSVIYKTIFVHLQEVYSFLLHEYSNLSDNLLLLSLECLSAWVVYFSKAEARSEQRYSNDLNLLIQFTLKELEDGFDIKKMDLYNKSFTVLTEFIDHIPRVMNPFKSKVEEVFFTPNRFGMSFFNTVFSSQDFLDEYKMEVDNYVNLLVNFLETNMIHMTRNLLDEKNFETIKIIIAITNAKGRPLIDENISYCLASFWEDFCNTLIDDEDVRKETLQNNSKLIEDYNNRRNSILMEVAVIYFEKIQRYSDEPLSEFSRYRTIVSDLFILFYTILGIPLFATLCDSIGTDLIVSEAAIYLLHKITVDIRFYDDDDDDETKNLPLINQFDSLFQNKLLHVINNDFRDQQITISLLNFMSILPFFYKSEVGNKYLSSSFEFLFNIINKNPNSNLALVASKTIFKICQNTEQKLIPFLPQLELIVSNMLKDPALDGLIRERITFSYVSILRSQKNQRDFGDKIFAILHLVIHQKDQADERSNEDYVVSLLACVNEISKACQLPEEVEDYFNITQLEEFKTYWQADPLNIRSYILEILKIFSLDSSSLSQNTIVTEKCCSILKSGLNETLPGPFTFDLNLIIQYIMAKALRSPPASIDRIHNLLISVILTNLKKLEQVQVEELLIKVVFDIAQTIQSDEDLIKSSLDVFHSIIDLKPSLLIYSSDLFNHVLQFAINSFSKNETSIIKSTVKFWNTLLVLRKGTQKDQEFIRSLMVDETNGKSLGFQLVEHLTVAFILSARSNLDYYYPLFRTLISKNSIDLKRWLTEVLENFQNGKVKLTKEEYNQFIGKLILTRGQRIANNVLKDFWLKINKLVDY